METFVKIDYSAIKDNYTYFRNSTKSEIICVVKSNAYGHGLVNTAKALSSSGASYFAVTSLGDGAVLMDGGVGGKVINMNYVPFEDLSILCRYPIIQSVYSLSWAKILNDFAAKSGIFISCHLKIDVGMGRLGFHYKDGFDDILKAFSLKNLVITGLYAHFSNADDKHSTVTDKEYSNFTATVEKLLPYFNDRPFCHIGNTSSFFNFPSDISDGHRIGMGLYGYNGNLTCPMLRPAMSFYTQLAHVRETKSLTTVGYGNFPLPSSIKKIGVLPVGYFNGVDLTPPFRVMIDGRPHSVLGRPCMNHVMIDLTDCDYPIGTPVQVFGPDSPIINGSVYQTLCRVGSLNAVI